MDMFGFIMIFDKLVGKCFIFLIITGLGQNFRRTFTKFCSKSATKMRLIVQISNYNNIFTDLKILIVKSKINSL